MHTAIQNMLKKYDCQSLDDYMNALKEILQQIALLGLWRSKFFEKAAFYGGTALRILHGLDRFSEDLDFSLIKPESIFNFQKYNEAILSEMESFGFQVSIDIKGINKKSTIHAATLKAEIFQQLIHISAPAKMVNSIHKQQKLKIKMEIDIHPPLHFTTEDKYILQPIPFSVNAFSLPDLFASKIHAILCRSWKQRGVKGRDWFDLVWYVGQKIPLGLIHLKERLVQSGDWDKSEPLKLTDVKLLLGKKIDNINIEQASHDVLPFIRKENNLSIWSKDFFRYIVQQITI